MECTLTGVHYAEFHGISDGVNAYVNKAAVIFTIRGHSLSLSSVHHASCFPSY